MELESPYSPAASEGDDLFEPPTNKTPSKANANSKPSDKFDSLLGNASKREAAKPASKTSSSKAATPKKDVKTSVQTSSGNFSDIIAWM